MISATSVKKQDWMMGHIFLIWPYFYYAIFCNARLHKNTITVLQQNWLYLFTIFPSGYSMSKK